MTHRRHGRVLCLILGGFLIAATFAAPGARGSVIPAEAIAWWRMDPVRFCASRAAGAERAAVVGLLRAMVASRVIEKESTSRIIEGVLAAAEVGAAEHTLCVLGLEAVRHPVDGLPDIRDLQIVLEVRTTADHRSFLRTIKAILIDAERIARGPDAPLGGQRKLDLPGALVGAAYSEPGWPTWREVSWVSTEGAFLVGLGRGSLERWLLTQREHAAKQTAGTAPERETSDAPWLVHRSLVGAERAGGRVFFEAYLNLDAMRRGFPDAFTQGRTQRIFAALRLSNGRDFMMHGRWIDPAQGGAAGAGAPAMIALDATWSARSEAPGTVNRRALSDSEWPAGELAMAPPPGSHIIALRVDWRELFEFGVAIAEALPRDRDLARKRASIGAWRSRVQGDVDRLIAGLRPWLVVSDTPTPPVPAPGASTLFAELAPSGDGAAAERIFGDVMAQSGKSIATDGAGTWWVRFDPKGVVRAPAWGFAGPAESRTLVFGWGVGFVTKNRERMGAGPGAAAADTAPAAR